MIARSWPEDDVPETTNLFLLKGPSTKSTTVLRVPLMAVEKLLKFPKD
jgi:hypothetical protein